MLEQVKVILSVKKPFYKEKTVKETLKMQEILKTLLFIKGN